MLNRKTLWQIAMEQSALEQNCTVADFKKAENTLTDFVPHPAARKYYKYPIPVNFVSYGNGVVASAQTPYKEAVRAFLNAFAGYRCFETPQLHRLDEALKKSGQGSCFMAEYWLPDPDKLKPLPCPYPTKLLTQKDFAPLYLPQWSNALCEKRRELDVLGVGAYDGEKLVGLAACSADCDRMRQIGIDVLPDYRRQGIASALTSTLAAEILKRDKVPFYCCAWSNVASARNAIKSGFVPAWTELTVKSLAKIEEMLQE